MHDASIGSATRRYVGAITELGDLTHEVFERELEKGNVSPTLLKKRLETVIFRDHEGKRLRDVAASLSEMESSGDDLWTHIACTPGLLHQWSRVIGPEVARQAVRFSPGERTSARKSRLYALHMCAQRHRRFAEENENYTATLASAHALAAAMSAAVRCADDASYRRQMHKFYAAVFSPVNREFHSRYASLELCNSSGASTSSHSALVESAFCEFDAFLCISKIIEVRSKVAHEIGMVL